MKRIALSGKRGLGKYAIVDDEDFERFSAIRWYLSADGYVRNDGAVRLALHREVIGAIPKGMWVDHANHDTLDNRRYNLRLCTPGQNHVNTRYRPNKSGYRGVSWHEKNGMWMARVTFEGRQLASYHKCVIEAAKAYNERSIEVYGEFAILNDLGKDTDHARRCGNNVQCKRARVARESQFHRTGADRSGSHRGSRTRLEGDRTPGLR